MVHITIIGLGPGDADRLTVAARERIAALQVLYLRTAVHPTVQALPSHLELRSFDYLYEQSSSLVALYQQIAEQLLERARAGEEVNYAVPGHPLVAEATTRHLLQLARESGIDVTIIDGLSFIEPVCSALKLDPLDQGLQLIDAFDLLQPPVPSAQGTDRAWVELQGKGSYQVALHPFPLKPTRPALLCQLYNARIASEVKLSLLERYPASHPITLVAGAGSNGETRIWTIHLEELDRPQQIDHLTAAYIPPLPVHEDLRSIDGILWVVQRLLGPFGCPWDREQTHRSLRPYLLEEAHETLEALDTGDDEALSEELGDLLLQILMHSELGRQEGSFDFGDVTAHIAAKLIRRHPHVFGDLAVSDTQEVLRNWDAIKAAERQEKGRPPKGPLDGVPSSLPALALAQQITAKAAKVGFDWPDLTGVWEKLHEELDELRSSPPAKQAEELGDLLFAIANLARWIEVDAESALRETIAKFRRRFAHIEQQAQAQGRDLADMSLAEMDALWDEAKSLEQ